MGKIRLTGATSGYTELQAASAAGNNTIILPTTNGGQVIVSDSSGNVNIDSGTFYVDASNNRVGIGTTSSARSAILTAKSANQTIASGNGQLSVITSDAQAADVGGSIVLGGQSGVADWVYASLSGRSENNSYAGYLAFATSSSSGFTSERARIDSSGRLLVGTSSTSKARTIIAQGNSGNANDGGVLQLSTGLATPANGDTLGYLMFADSSHDQGAQILGQRDGGTWSASSKPSRLVFSTCADGASSPTERMRITNAGRIFVNTTSPGFDGRLYIMSNQETEAGITTQSSNGAIVTQTVLRVVTGSNTVIGSITHNSLSTSFNTSSDYRLKENVVAVTDGITRLQQLKPSRFNFIADPDKTVDGFIAHEVQTVVPEAITGEKDAVDDDGNPKYQGIDQSKLVPLLTAALQEAIGEIESLKARVAALESA